MGNYRTLSLVFVLVVGIAALFTVYTVSEVERAVKLRLGAIVEEDIPPGLHFKIPGIHTVKKFDARIIALDVQPELFFTSEQKQVFVDYFINWKIAEGGVADYFITTGGNLRNAQSRLENIINSELREEFARRTVQEVISGEREELMDILVSKSNNIVRDLGIELIDVRVKRIEFPSDVRQAIFKRMETERKKVAQDFRAKGAEEAAIIRAAANKERVVILANAQEQSEIIRGQGDAKAAEIYANAYGENSDFYAFYRRLMGYRNTLSSKDDILLVKPESDFFKYLNSVSGTPSS